ncbi:MAG: pyridoxamine 5'-phosphate oxidase family protein [Syntrophales bacterium]|nr:pyridoxamine 5'-phosphate oxidase family protein [Syntrophales bacterium]
MKEVITGAQAWVATVGEDGKPNIAIKGSAGIVDDESLVYFEMVGGRTWVNIQKNPWVALAVANDFDNPKLTHLAGNDHAKMTHPQIMISGT